MLQSIAALGWMMIASLQGLFEVSAVGFEGFYASFHESYLPIVDHKRGCRPIEAARRVVPAFGLDAVAGDTRCSSPGGVHIDDHA